MQNGSKVVYKIDSQGLYVLTKIIKPTKNVKNNPPSSLVSTKITPDQDRKQGVSKKGKAAGVHTHKDFMP